jgi:hypothetical protein
MPDKSLTPTPDTVGLKRKITALISAEQKKANPDDRLISVLLETFGCVCSIEIELAGIIQEEKATDGR